MRIARIAVLATLAFALTACGTATVTSAADGGKSESGTSSSKAAKPSKAAGIGDLITLKGADDSKIAVKVTKVIAKGKPANEIVKADAGKRLYGVEVIFKNTGGAAYDDAPSNGAAVIDAEGQSYDASLFGEIAGAHNIGKITIAKGGVRKGFLVFEVDEKAKIVKLQLALNSGFADQKGEWKLT